MTKYLAKMRTDMMTLHFCPNSLATSVNFFFAGFASLTIWGKKLLKIWWICALTLKMSLLWCIVTGETLTSDKRSLSFVIQEGYSRYIFSSVTHGSFSSVTISLKRKKNRIGELGEVSVGMLNMNWVSFVIVIGWGRLGELL